MGTSPADEGARGRRHGRLRLAVVLVAFVLASTLPAAASAADGDLDPGFGSGGTTATVVGPGVYGFASDMIVQADDRIVLAGAGAAVSSANIDMMLARYDANGNLDPTFGSGGFVFTDFGNANDQGIGIVQQADGKMVVAGYAQTATGDVIPVARYLPDGSLDPTFGVGGKVTVGTPGFADDGNWIAIQPDGKVVIAAYETSFPYTFGSSNFLVVRLNTDGSLDTTFAGDGKAVVDIGPTLEDAGVGAAIAPDGDIIAVGSVSPSVGPYTSDFGVVRLNPDGTPDTGFGPSSNGIVLHDLGGVDFPYTATVQPDGQIIVAGARPAGGTLLRLNPDGSRDTSFGVNGVASTGFNGTAYSATVLADGRILATGSQGSQVAVARLLPDGTLDPTFGSGGVSVATIPGLSFQLGQAVRQQADGTIVVGGYGSDATLLVAGFEGGGGPPPDGNGDGILDVLQPVGTPAGSFVDNGVVPPTSGSIVANPTNLAVNISDAPSPDGVQVTVGAGAGSVTLSVCGGFTVGVAAGSTVVLTCGSVLVEVISGSAVISLGTQTSVSVPDGGTVKVTDLGGGAFTVANLGPTAVSTTVGGIPGSIPAGGTTQVATWTFTGFAQPVDNAGALNIAKAGRAIPLKWRFTLPDGSPVTNLTSVHVSVVSMSCSGAASTDEVEQYAVGASGLQNLGSGNYQFNWQAPGSYANSCKTLRLEAGDGAVHTALFKFTK